MQNRDISIQIQRLQSLIKRSTEATKENIELQGDWAKYLCVLTAGLLENSIKQIYSDFANRTVATPLANFVSSNLSPIRSPRTQRFLEISSAFSMIWRGELENYFNDNGRGEAIDSIMRHRHLIAHGQYRNSNISMVQLKEYFTKAIEIMEFIDSQARR
jgi:hypothetical protein